VYGLRGNCLDAAGEFLLLRFLGNCRAENAASRRQSADPVAGTLIRKPPRFFCLFEIKG